MYKRITLMNPRQEMALSSNVFEYYYLFKKAIPNK